MKGEDLGTDVATRLHEFLKLGQHPQELQIPTISAALVPRNTRRKFQLLSPR